MLLRVNATGLLREAVPKCRVKYQVSYAVYIRTMADHRVARFPDIGQEERSRGETHFGTQAHREVSGAPPP